MADKKPRPCKDCKEGWGDKPPPPSRIRPAPYSGPRCKEHHYKERERLRKAAHERRVGDVYGLPAGAYDKLLAAQGGKCANPVCKGKGVRKRLAVDHDHKCCSGPKSCGRCVRGLLCTNCNDMLGTARDDANYFVGLIAYLANPPAKAVLDAILSDLPDRPEGDGGGPVVQAPPKGSPVRRERDQPIPGIDQYAEQLGQAWYDT